MTVNRRTFLRTIIPAALFFAYPGLSWSQEYNPGYELGEKIYVPIPSKRRPKLSTGLHKAGEAGRITHSIGDPIQPDLTGLEWATRPVHLFELLSNQKRLSLFHLRRLHVTRSAAKLGARVGSVHGKDHPD